jgi:hypothetical protein
MKQMLDMHKRREMLAQCIATNEHTRALVTSTLFGVCELLSALQTPSTTANSNPQSSVNRVPRMQLLKEPNVTNRISPPLQQQPLTKILPAKKPTAFPKPAVKNIQPAIQPQIFPQPPPQITKTAPTNEPQKPNTLKTTQRKKDTMAVPTKQTTLKRPALPPPGTGSLLKMPPPSPPIIASQQVQMSTNAIPAIVDLSNDESELTLYTPPKKQHSDGVFDKSNTSQSDFLSTSFGQEVSMFSPNSLQFLIDTNTNSNDRKRKERSPSSSTTSVQQTSSNGKVKRRRIHFNQTENSVSNSESPDDSHMSGKSSNLPLQVSPDSSLWDLSLSGVLGNASNTGGTPPHTMNAPTTSTGSGFLTSPMSASLESDDQNVRVNLSDSFAREAKKETKPTRKKKKKQTLLPTNSMQEVESFLSQLHSK